MNKEMNPVEPEATVQNPDFEPEYEIKKLYPGWQWSVPCIVLILWAIFLPLGKWYQWLLMLAVAAALFLTARMLSTPVLIRVPRLPELARTGNKETDRLLKASVRYLNVAEKSMELITVWKREFGYSIARLIGFACRILEVTSSGISGEKVDEKLLTEYIPSLCALLNCVLEKKKRRSEELMRDITDAVTAMLPVFEKQCRKMTTDSRVDFAEDMEKLDEILSRETITAELDDALPEKIDRTEKM